MPKAQTISTVAAALVLAVAGLLALGGSFVDWGSCPTTPCGGPFQAFSEYSGFDIGFGFVTALAGVLLTAIGLGSVRDQDIGRFATAAALLALLIVVTAGASVIWMYIIPGDDKQFTWPPYTAIAIGIVGLIALAASLALRRAIPLRQ